MMLSHYIFRTISVLSTIVSAAMLDFDPPESFGDDTLFSNPELPSSPSLISFNQPLSPPDPNLSLFDSSQLPDNAISFFTGYDKDTSDLPSWDFDDGISTSNWSDDNNEFNLFSDDPFKLADCSASESLPMIRRSRRLRRRDDLKCTNPAATPQLSLPTLELNPNVDLGSLDQISQDPETAALREAAEKNSDNNVSCYLLTKGQLPWGVCSSGVESSNHRYGRSLEIGVKHLEMWWLRPCSLGTLSLFFFLTNYF